MKSITIRDFLTESEVKRAFKLYYLCQEGKDERRFVHAINQDIIKPNIDRINAALGQENDPMYLSYACEYIISRS